MPFKTVDCIAIHQNPDIQIEYFPKKVQSLSFGDKESRDQITGHLAPRLRVVQNKFVHFRIIFLNLKVL